jgi:phosphohistidine phosphatase
MMEVFLVRHAIAHERNARRWPDDALRPLTPAGAGKFRKAARGLARLLPEQVALLTSPYVRARATAAILARVLKRDDVVDCSALGADQLAREAFELLRSRRDDAVVLVGHEPYLGEFMSAALTETSGLVSSEFRKGGAALLEFPGQVRPGKAVLKWFMPPRVLRSLR